jgi:protein arginine N-methyltransferase 1
MYSLEEYGEMIADSVRLNAYSEAIRRAVRPGDVVVDLGCGTGIMALLACRAGARRVYAIDPADTVHIAREIAAENGYAERITFFQSDSRRVELPERARVLVSDLRGVVPFYGDSLLVLQDARNRFLSSDGVLIPARDTLWVAIVDAGPQYERLVKPWARDTHGFDLAAARKAVLHSVLKERSSSLKIVAGPEPRMVLEYPRLDSPNTLQKAIMFHVKHSGAAHGLCVWFDTQLFEDVGFSCAPGEPDTIYGRLLLLWPEPVDLIERQEISVQLCAKLVGQDYVWCWTTEVGGRSGVPPKRFEQSSFFGAPVTPERLRRRAAGFVPSLGEEGMAERFMLNLIDGQTPLEVIARRAAERFPRLFKRWEDALARAAQVAERYSR